ncbi:TRAF-type zinc finger domain-containing protein 1 [Biomphalaria pfeifferi]|uniref:TRAF-type zinc finger domain-containing protein 1 n=1 Tax=Biomphalaria pfeifferi TaxID=112525 RepID=A0AAD8F8Z6_BIOPF|nr:TRAF-type zinc finger domain-containing protein 1 [Biomphalaria pfeifferi]
MADDTKLCQNCKRDIASANFVMHEVHCRRHIVLCKDCNEPVPRAELEEHFQELHAQVPCEKCGKTTTKDAMAKHLADDCAKKLLQCTYCDLSVTKEELESHMGYCGTRTECCPLCQQYIMLKDMLRHESSGCTYPEPKPPQQLPQSEPGVYSMEELQRLLNGSEFGVGDFFTDPHTDFLFPFNTNKSNVTLSNPVSNGLSTSAVYKKSDVNVHRDKKSPPELADDSAISHDIDYDEMLALQLAQEWEQDDVDIDSDLAVIHHKRPVDLSADLVSSTTETHVTIKKPLSPIISKELLQPSRLNKEPDSNDDVDEETKIPCEFCDLEVALHTYFDHVENCQISRFFQLSQSVPDLNNEISSPQMSMSRHSIPVINNLRSMPRTDHVVPKLSPSDDDFMLPCEFCEEMFPSEIIIQHQSLCQANEQPPHREATSTQREDSSFVSSSRGSHNVKMRSVRNYPSTMMPEKSGRSRHRQSSPSLINYVGQDGGDADENINYKKPLTAMRPLESTSNKYSSYPVSRFDPAVTKPPRRLSRHNSHGDDDGPDFTVSKQEQRTRARLNQFLQDDVSQGASPYTKKDASISKSMRTTGQERIGGDRKSNVDSRTVLRQMEDRAAMRQTEDSPTRRTEENKQTSSRKRASHRSHLSNETAAEGPANRNLSRSHHVFSPDLRLKPENKIPPKKR